jgi:hypothetical protein
MNKRTAQEKAEQRAAARKKRQEAAGPSYHVMRRAWIRHQSAVRLVACDAVHLEYKPIPVPRTRVEQEVFGHFTDEHMAGDLANVNVGKVRENTRKSWEILTERA